MDSLDELMQAAVNDGTAPGVVVLAKDREGKVDIAKAFSSENGTLYTLDTAMMISSMSKFPTSVAALQLVDQGLITLDEDLSPLLPSLAAQGILTSVADDGAPAVRPRQNPITLRHLLSHSSGVGYHFLDKRLGKVRAWQQKQRESASPPSGTVEESCDLPLLFEPGEGWAYGFGLDWVGPLVEKLAGGVSLEDFMRRNIWEPLGVSSSTFFPDQHPDISARRVPMAFRASDGGPAVEKPGAPSVADGLKVCFGGHGLYASMADCFRIADSLLVNDEKLLRRETVEEMFRPQLTPASRAELRRFMDTSDMQMLFPSPPIDRDYGLGGLLIAEDGHEYFRRGAMMWGGAANLNWFIDRAAGVCGVFGSQVMPPGDAKMRKLINAFQAEVYRRAAKVS
ncbi:hypothetical protein SLS62_000534 [Diatrype stigma]|uniref:Beta-lactamase-related domain-containing protein n=1 Tax=Diatrype stigma TaxID=117547 RepID=A0AAN9YWY6_9PEZI